MTRVPIGNALERIAGTDESRFIEVAADKLKGDGTTVRGKAGGKRNGRASGHVERAGKAQQSGYERRVFAERSHLGEGRRGEGLGRHGDEIDRLKQEAHRAAERFAPQYDLLIIGAGLRKAKIEQSRKPGAIFVLARGIGCFVRDRRLNATKRKPVIDNGLGVRERDLTDLAPSSAAARKPSPKTLLAASSVPSLVQRRSTPIVTPRRLPGSPAR